jgi:hypothetical protein
VRTQARFDRSCVLLASPGAVPVQRGRSRIATFGRLFEGTDEISLGQTTRDGPFGCLIRHSFHERPRHLQDRPVNVAELLARRTKTVSFWQCHFTVRWRPTTTQDGRHPRAHSAHCDEPRGPTFRHMEHDTTTAVGYPQSVDNHVDSLASSIRPSARRAFEGARFI